MRLLKYFGVALAVLLALVIVAGVALTFFFDANVLKPRIEQLVMDETGRRLTIEGDLKPSVFPWLGIEIGATQLGDAAGFGDQPFAQVQGVNVKVKMLPLLQKKIEADTISLAGLRVRLVRNAEGVGNWEDLIASDAAPGSQAPASDSSSAAPALSALAINGLAITDAELNWTDHQAGTRAAVRNLKVTTGELGSGDPVDVEAGFDVESSQPELQGRVDFQGVLTMDLAAQRYAGRDSTLSLDLSGPTLPGGHIKSTTELDVDIDLEAQKVTSPMLSTTLVLDGQDLSGQLTLKGVASADLAAQNARFGDGSFEFELSGALLPLARLAGQAQFAADADLSAQRLTVPTFDAKVTVDDPTLTGSADLKTDLTADLVAQRFSIENGSLTFDVESSAVDGGPIDGSVQMSKAVADLARQTASIPSLQAKALGVDVQINALNAQQIVDAPEVTGTVKISQFVPREVMQRLGIAIPVTADPKVLGKAAASFALAADTNAASLSKIAVELDDSKLTGEQLSVQGFSNPLVSFNIALDRIDVDRYLPPRAASGQAPAGVAAEAQSQSASQAGAGIPVEALRALRLKGQAQVGQLKVSNLRLSKAYLRVDAVDGLLKIDPLHMELYQGKGFLAATLDVRRDQPTLALKNSLSSIQAEPLLNDLLGEAMITGMTNFSADLTTRGATPQAMTRGLNGSTAFSFKNGALKGINIAQSIREAQALLKGRRLPPSEGPNQTDFAELRGHATITDGVVNNPDLSAKSPLLRVQANGTANLPQETLDYSVAAQVVGTLEGQGGKDMSEISGVEIPIRITGTFANPKVSPDAEKLARNLAARELEKRSGRIEKEVDKHLGEGAGGAVNELLKGILKR